MDAQGYEDAIYRPRFIVVAREVAEPLMEDDWKKVEDILVAPVSVPVLNAAAVRSDDGAMAVIVYAPMYVFLPMVNGLVWAAAEAADDSDLGKLGALRRQMDKHLEAVLDMRKTDHASLYRFPTVAEYKTSHDLQRVQSIFVILHEYAHVTSGHLSNSSLVQGTAIGLRSSVSFYTQSQIQEFEADAQAMHWLLSGTLEQIFVRVQPIFNDLGFAISRSLGALFALLACVESLLPQSDSHPGIVDRSTALQRILESKGYAAAGDDLKNWTDIATQFAAG